MDFETKITQIVKEIIENRELYEKASVEQTKQTLVLPFIEALGYNTRSIADVQWGNPLTDGVDCTLVSGESIILIVCNKLGTKIEENVIKKLKENYNKIESSNKLGIITDGENYVIFADSVVAGCMDSKPFDAFKISSTDRYSLEKIEKLTKENINKHRIVLEMNYKIFEEMSNNAITDIICGKAHEGILNAILENSELKHYKGILDTNKLRQIISEQAVKIITSGLKSKNNKIFKELESQGFDMNADDVYDFDINDDIPFTEENIKIKREIIKKYAGKTVKLKEIPHNVMDVVKLNKVVIEGKEINIKNSRDALIELIKYCINKDTEIKDTLVTLFRYKTFRIENGQEMEVYNKVKPVYLKEYNVSIMIHLNTRKITEFMSKIMEIAKINYNDVEVGLDII